ncbi:putative hydroxymethylpyrimidine transport system ATP-binding protein [Bacillus sp. OV166]|uniref:ABC transporter ATP-binding protein n=1 Tax=unclassified Bacillus (in: firmicutes) TaxID=185979 RepID=UPI000A2ADD09|nr:MULTISPECIES: ABC transporter ATP-binding protein [unclassified Bacillus (in: firmicutes)]PGY08379.1 ABC transporter ATP-binding protein [Bacillus sp. AFS031507]SMQ77312.1 putative hydroxymethylpyrimidine transport system ATP-binding protein [Bacillus sp. OV166]
MLSIKNLSYSFQSEGNSNPIFNQISLDVKPGEFVSVIGASGSGKSTLFKLISGLLEPDQGDIMVNGQKTGKRLGSIGYMPQKDLLLPWRTVLENVLLPLEVTKEPKQARIPEIREWLSRFGLAEYEKAYPNELSGGMKQRVAFLRTLMTGKDLLLLDEPFGALDSLTKRNMHSWLLGLWGELQKTVLFITHDLEEAVLLSDRIYLLQDTGIKEMKVNLARPRSSQLIYQSEFITMRKELEWLIQNES